MLPTKVEKVYTDVTTGKINELFRVHYERINYPTQLYRETLKSRKASCTLNEMLYFISVTIILRNAARKH